MFPTSLKALINISKVSGPPTKHMVNYDLTLIMHCASAEAPKRACLNFMLALVYKILNFMSLFHRYSCNNCRPKMARGSSIDVSRDIYVH